MNAIAVTARRTIGQVHSLFSTVFAVGCFLAVSAASFALSLASAEGSHAQLAVVWAASVAPVLPAFVALLAMDVWSAERASGRIDLLLSVAVRERSLVLGKFAGVWLLMVTSLVALLVASVGLLWLFAPSLVNQTPIVSFLLALGALTLQGTVWCAASVLASAVFCHAAAAACGAILLLVAIPRGLWAGLMVWSREGRTAFGEMPLDAHVIDLVSGIIPIGTVAAYVVSAVVLLFAAVKCIVWIRLVGRGAAAVRLTTAIAVFLSVVVALLTVSLTLRVNPTLDLPVAGLSPELSPRTRSILMDAGGSITVTCFVSRQDQRFRSISQLLRRFKRESDSVGGARLELHFVDPRWDLGAAERLVRRRVPENSLVFEKGSRLVSFPLAEGYGERQCAAAIGRIASLPMSRNKVCWTVGHGEKRHDAYDAFGMSDIARDIVQDGFTNESLDLNVVKAVPADCALVVIAGANDDFSRVELSRLDSYLKDGGRLLVLLGSVKSGGVVSMLPAWGMRPEELPLHGEKTFSGTDVVVSGFTDHAISAPLKGARIVLERPVSFSPSAVVETGSGADRIDFSAVAEVSGKAVVSAVERGMGAGKDLALRPTRIVVIGDAGFAVNGQLEARANANRDLFLNCVAYLSGAEPHGAGISTADVLESGMDRRKRFRHVVWSTVGVPAIVFLLLGAVVVRRRRRS